MVISNRKMVRNEHRKNNVTSVHSTGELGKNNGKIYKQVSR